MTGTDSSSKNFMKNIRKYNSALAFASMGCKIAQHQGDGPYCFKIHDQIYHQISSIHPQNNEKPKYCQLYILDSETALRERMENNINSKCNPDVI
jgi:hypothetical protein